MRRRRIQMAANIAIALATIAALAFILQRRAEQPENYPAFSSYRTLPDGASVLYQALQRIPGMSAERNIRPPDTVGFNGAAILMLGIRPTVLDGDAIEALATKGSRVIVGLLPERGAQVEDALKRWNVRLASYPKGKEEEDELMYFSQSKGWATLYDDDGKAWVIQKAMGKGTLVLMANSYFFSNQAMVEDRRPGLLSDVIGPVHQVVFDETHLGIEESGSVAALARRYRLQGLVLGLVLLAALFIWKNAAGFPPVREGDRPVASLRGEDSAASFLNLLRRSIAPGNILATCVEEWYKMFPRKAGNRLRDAIDLAEGGRKTSVQTYAQIQQILGAKRNPS